jgi:hypothetical protein
MQRAEKRAKQIQNHCDFNSARQMLDCKQAGGKRQLPPRL